MTEFQILNQNKAIKIPQYKTQCSSQSWRSRSCSIALSLPLSPPWCHELLYSHDHLHRQVSFSFYSSQSFLPLTDRFLSLSLSHLCLFLFSSLCFFDFDFIFVATRFTWFYRFLFRFLFHLFFSTILICWWVWNWMGLELK